MPKEKPCLSQVTSTKCAKDKSNSSTLLAMRDAKHSNVSSGRGSCYSSENDSGFSDNGSEWQQTDSEEQQSLKSQSSAEAKTHQKDGRDSGKPAVAAAGPPIQPLYIIKNIVVNQGDKAEPSVAEPTLPIIVAPDSTQQMHGGSSDPLPAPHLILLQQPILMPTSFQSHKSVTRKANAAGRKASATYLPILNSYPRIAPHPCKKQPPDKAVSEAQNLIKRVCTEPVAGPKQNVPAQPEKVPQSSSRHRRFLNTVGILSQSGLLDITVQTKELLHQSMATDRDIALLRQHTELLCQAACSGSSTPPGGRPAWESLHRMMQESGCYPDLSPLQEQTSQPRKAELKAATHCDTHPASEILEPNGNREPPQLNRVQEQELKAASSKVAVMSPDSSTS
ncbi:CLOCK-interacting pacemaker [Synchiropus splendidus]|uniref:CLOCK-interacting pacemaker n=1 Tax=Synchiropus splendidus TaxID=270530 RepID=UPI00237E190D|nr:CLOCK-interacting pacemaker [Synchiropus splendidus]